MDAARFASRLADMVDSIPGPLLRELNGGIIVSDDRKQHPHDPAGLYILGEYVTDPQLGRMVVLYYGSFAVLFRGQPDGVWEREMWDTLRHELRHHVEGLAGVDDLEREDAQQLAAWRGRAAAGPQRGAARGGTRRPRR